MDAFVAVADPTRRQIIESLSLGEQSFGAVADQFHISRPAVSEKRLLLTPNGNIRYPLKTPYRDGATHVIF